MIAFPVLAALVSLAFAIHLLARAGKRGGWAEAVWGIAMLMFSVGSAALALGVADGWTTAEFRTYWLFGAVLNVPYLGLGEAYLLFRRKAAAHVLLLVVLAATAYAAGVVRTAPLDTSVLASHEFFTGREVLGSGTLGHVLAPIYSFSGYGLLVVGALWSAWGMRGRPELRNRFLGLLLIVLGATIVAGGAAFAAAGSFVGFSITLAAGVSVMYWGFLVATRRPAARSPAPAR